MVAAACVVSSGYAIGSRTLNSTTAASALGNGDLEDKNARDLAVSFLYEGKRKFTLRDRSSSLAD